MQKHPYKPTLTPAQREAELLRNIKFYDHVTEHGAEELAELEKKRDEIQTRINAVHQRIKDAPEKRARAVELLQAVRKSIHLKEVAPKLDRLQKLQAEMDKLKNEIGDE
jgi:DNA-binding PadR family transcriptional regulator